MSMLSRTMNSRVTLRRTRQLSLESMEKRLTLDGEPLVALSLEAVDLNGNVLTKLTVDQPFELRIMAEDLRAEPEGIFAAYMDVLFPADLVEASGNLQVEDPFINGISGSIGDGLLDEVGSFSNSLVPLGGGRAVIGTYRFTAINPGTVEFQTNPADSLPFHDVLVYGRNVEVGTGQVTYGILEIDTLSLLGTTLTLVAEAEASPEVVANDDQRIVLSDSDTTSIDVLANDTIPAGVTVSIVSVTPAQSNGSAHVSADQKTILYKPASGMIATETLTYVVRDQAGNESTADLTIDVVSRFQNQVISQDRDGNGSVVPLDVLYGINALNQRGPKKLEASDLTFDGIAIFFDVNGDGFHSAIDELLCINLLNQNAASEGEGASFEAAASTGMYQDQAIAGSTMGPIDVLFGAYQNSEWIAESTSTIRRRR